MVRLNRSHVELGTTLALTFVTGIVDAVGYLGLDRVFTGNMTGNIVILGMGVAGADELPVLGPAPSLWRGSRTSRCRSAWQPGSRVWW
ncbi:MULTISPECIES: YoaK family protein [unclassified Mycolicibacterium]|uniref:YoaK family protein n=1 Tax=unclassified Mycolicibacterium TaxID=2636767 RepID=UPI002ED9D534